MAGKTEKFRAQWSKITSDRWILRTICGYQVELTDTPDQTFDQTPIKFSKLEEEANNKEILDFTKKGIIEPVMQADPDEFMSNIFVRPKSNGDIRVILNLKPFNQQYVDKIHFKMESLKSAMNALTPNCFLASVDLKLYIQNKSLCIVSLLREYIDRTFSLRGQETQLIISTQAPFKGVARATISRWVKRVMDKAGIDVNCFKPHSTRAAASSHAKAKGAPLSVIMNTAGWTQNSTFRKFYDKPVQGKSCFQSAILGN